MSYYQGMKGCAWILLAALFMMSSLFRNPYSIDVVNQLHEVVKDLAISDDSLQQNSLTTIASTLTTEERAVNSVDVETPSSRIVAPRQPISPPPSQQPTMPSAKAPPDATTSPIDPLEIFSDNVHTLELMKSPVTSLLEPHQILKEYISHHGVHVQGDQGIRAGQKYILLQYYCPERAGNTFSSALNEIVLAILTNRTLLWKYDASSDQEACESVLHRASWIPPAYKVYRRDAFQWRQREQSIKACENVLNTTKQYICMERLKRAPVGTAAKFSFAIHQQQVIDIRGVTGCIHSEISGWQGRFDMRVPTCAEFLRATFGVDMIDQERIDMLYKHGLDFLYGMLFRHSFGLTEEFLNSIKTVGGKFDPAAFSVAVHSRHAYQYKDGSVQDGSNISMETSCLDNILAVRNASSHTKEKTCQLLIMSDREATNEALTKYAKENGCQGITVAHTKIAKNKLKTEHGPFEGAGYWKDMAFVTQARGGLVATTRSSSGFLQNLLVYDRSMERLSQGNETKRKAGSLTVAQLHGLDVCVHQYEGPDRPDWPTTNRRHTRVF